MFDDNFSLDCLNPRELKELLTINDVVKFFHSFGVTDLDVTKDMIIAPTICHNPLGAEAKKKLYWYQETKLFRCYTECQESFDIYRLYMKIMALNYHEVNFIDAFYYVKQFVNPDAILSEHRVIDAFVSDRDKYQPRKQLLYNTPINPCVLDCFQPATPSLWLAEGISKEAMKRFDVRYSIAQESIILPQYEYRPDNPKGELVGIRCRELNPDRIEAYAKYHPIYLGNEKYGHHVSYCPYGLAQQHEAVKKFRKAIIVEGEKSVMKGFDYYGEDSVILAACGIASFGIYQINILTKQLGVNDITLAFDKEFKRYGDADCIKWKAMLDEKCKKYSYCANMHYILDKNGLLDEKESPVDRGKEVFERLLQDSKKR